jgi:type IV secretion system protein VirD4
MPGIASRPGSAISWCHGRRPPALLTSGELMQLPPADEIVMVAGAPPIRAKKARYHEDTRFKERILPPPELSSPRKPHADDSSALPLPPKPKATEAGPARAEDDEDPTQSERRRQPELERVKPVDKKEPIENEFEIDEDSDGDDDAARNRQMLRTMQGVARQVSMDPGDGMEL